MNTTSALPEYLSKEQRQGIRALVESVEFLPISCLLHKGDQLAAAGVNRVIPDDFIYMPTKGTLDCTVGGQHSVIEPGEFIMAPAGVPHSVAMAEGVHSYEVFALHMHLYDATHHRFLVKMDAPFGSVSDLDAWTPRLAACVCLMGRSPAAGGAYMRQLVIALLVEQILRGRRLQRLPATIDSRVYALLAQIREHPSNDWTVTRMAKCCHLSVSRFRQLFVASTATAPAEYVQKVRLSLARSLLMTMPGLTVKQVADKVGIASSHHFHAIYRERFGETPRRR